MGSSPVADLVATTLKAVVEVFLLCIVGYILARRGIIDDHSKKRLNLINVSFFTPCLLFSKVAFTLTPAKLADLYIVPIGFLLATAVSYGIGYVLGVAFRLPKSKRNFAVACAMFMNCNSLPVALMQSLVTTVPSLKWGEDDDPDQMLGRALSYLVLCSTLGIILRWSYGVNLLSAAEDDSSQTDDEDSESETESDTADDSRPLISSQKPNKRGSAGARTAGSGVGNGSVRGSPSSVTFAYPHDQTSPQSVNSLRHPSSPPRFNLPEAAQELPPQPPASQQKPATKRQTSKHVFASFPGTPREWRTPAASVKSRPGSSYDLAQHARDALDREGEDEDDEEGGGNDEERAWGPNGRWHGSGRQEVTEPSRSRLRRAGRKTWSFTKRTVKRIGNFMTAPLYAALLSIIVALIRPLQAFLDDLTPLRGALASAGSCSVPITLVVLGAYFYTPGDPHTAPTKQNVKPGPSFPRPRNARDSHGTAVSEPDEDHYDSLAPRIDNPPSPQFISPRSSQATLVGKFQAWRSNRRERSRSRSAAEKKQKSLETRTVLVGILARMIVAPLVLLPLLALWAAKTVNVADDPVFIMVACLVVGSPPAITLAQMTQAVGEAFERLISNTLFFSYAIVTPVTTVLLVLIGLLIDRKQDEAGNGFQ